jgi:hypothetical protein
MKRILTIAVLSSLLCLPAAAQRPSPADQQKTLDTAREIAVHYNSKLPDFICTEQVVRTDRLANGVKADKLTLQLSYAAQKEKYKLVTMNGQPATQPLESLDGLITGGEFGSLLAGVFDPTAAADFQWKSATNLRKHAAAVYTYKIVRAKSHYMVGHRVENGNMVAAAAGFHGEVTLDSQSSRVLRLTAVADDIPNDSGILQSSVEVDYDFIDVAGKSYLLPSRSESHMERAFRQIANVVTFADYKKFEADSTIDFKAPGQ